MKNNGFKLAKIVVMAMIVMVVALFSYRAVKYRKGDVTYAVYFIPFNAHSYTPVMFEDIEEQSEFLFEASSSKLDALFGDVEAIAINPKKAAMIRPLSYVDINAKIIRLADRKAIYLQSESNSIIIYCDKKDYAVDKSIVDRATEIILWRAGRAGPKYNEWSFWKYVEGRRFWDYLFFGEFSRKF